MHVALGLPEIVDMIVNSDDSLGFLQSCLLVNRTFSKAAVRAIWAQCGESLRHPHREFPPIIHLVQLIKKHPARAHEYAGCIRALFLNINLHTDEDDHVQIRPNDDSQWLPTIKELSFPKLEKISLYGGFGGYRYNFANEILHHAGERLTTFQSFNGGRLSDSFLSALAIKSPNLRSLSLSIFGDHCAETFNTVTDNGIIQLCNNLPKLHSLFIIAGFDRNWSDKVLDVLARHKNLVKIMIPHITDKYPGPVTLPDPFPKLRKLKTSVSNYALGNLIPHLPNLTALNLSVTDGSSLILVTISQIRALQSLKLMFPWKCLIKGTHLLQLAAGLPQLRILQLTNPVTFPTGTDSTDDIIDRMAYYLPGLQVFSLQMACKTLTYRSLIALSKKCRQLEKVEMMVDMDFEVFARESERWLSLHTLRLEDGGEGDKPAYKDPVLLARQLRLIWPNIRTVECKPVDGRDSHLVADFNACEL